jgi:hypothetical protein
VTGFFYAIDNDNTVMIDYYKEAGLVIAGVVFAENIR